MKSILFRLFRRKRKVNKKVQPICCQRELNVAIGRYQEW